MLRLCCLKEIFHWFAMPACRPVTGAACCLAVRAPQTCTQGLPSAHSPRTAPSGGGQTGCPSQGRTWHSLVLGLFAHFSAHLLVLLYFFLSCEAHFSLLFFSISFSILAMLSASPNFLKGEFFIFLLYFLPVSPPLYHHPAP